MPIGGASPALLDLIRRNQHLLYHNIDIVFGDVHQQRTKSIGCILRRNGEGIARLGGTANGHCIGAKRRIDVRMRQALEPKADIRITSTRDSGDEGDAATLGKTERIQRAVVIREASPALRTRRKSIGIRIRICRSVAKGTPGSRVKASFHWP